MVWQAIGHSSSTPLNEACRAKHRVTTKRSTSGIKSIRGSPKWLSRPSEKIFEYRYEDFTKEFRRATRALGRKDIVPYQCRHSGASLDKLEIKKRGMWKSDNSIVRYQKSGRLAQIQSDPNTSQLTYFKATDLTLEELIFGRHRVADVLRPSLMVPASS